MLQPIRRRKTTLTLVAIVLVIAITTTAVACKPTDRWFPAVETFSAECKAIAKRSHARANLQASVCDLNEKVQRLEQRITELETARQTP